MYYRIFSNVYILEDLNIQDNTCYLKTEGKWLIFKNDNFIDEWNYSSLIVKEKGIIGVKDNRYAIFSNDLNLINSDLVWASITDNGIIIKEKKENNLIVSIGDTMYNLKGYDYAEVCSNGFYIAWNISGLVPEWFLLNSYGEIIETSNARIIEFSERFFIKKNNGIIIIDKHKEKKFDTKYSNFMDGGECFFLFNNVTGCWELYNKDMKFIVGLNLFNVPVSVVYDNIVILKNNQNQTLNLYNISSKELVEINNYRIGERYLFVKYAGSWERIY